MTKMPSHEWHAIPSQQQPEYKDKNLLNNILAQLTEAKPLVQPEELTSLRDLLAQAARGQAFILQGGNCAELFSDCNPTKTQQKLMMLRQLSLMLESEINIPVVGIGRIAGQYAKPRTVLQETRGDLCLPSYRGDLINQADFTPIAREPNPHRLLLGYQAAAATMNDIRDYLMREPSIIMEDDFWQRAYLEIQQLHLHKAVDLSAIRDKLNHIRELLPLFTSHEALLLSYEEALTRVSTHDRYNAGTHFPWIGMRTSDPTMEHVAYAASIANPIAVKIGTQVNAEYLIGLIRQLNPKQIPGRLTLIHRFGNDNIAELLPPLIVAAKKAHAPITWICDPMHGNTHYTTHGMKTRQFHDIKGELLQAFDIHQAYDSMLAGIHIEMTEEPVTECLGSKQQLTEIDLTYGYKSLVDPRLNYGQTLELLMILSEHRKS